MVDGEEGLEASHVGLTGRVIAQYGQRPITSRFVEVTVQHIQTHSRDIGVQTAVQSTVLYMNSAIYPSRPHAWGG